ncbi:Asp-tRNA(Asn)/Glu-tRNA(Gln) amidotransferase subunit GatC [bacterium]|nr:MAG: Asp-tRNA(Asn)/Glu-tRNA(Gln) amidotransferase subunit GatC [bacterium]
MSVTINEVKKIATLANLEFNENELEKYTHQLNTILEYVDQLNKVDTSSVEATCHPISYQDVFRDDEIKESLPIDKVLQNAPEKTWQYFVVPKVVGS